MGAFFLQNLRILRLVSTPHRNPLADLLNSGSSLRYTFYSEKPCDCGDRACLGLSRNRAQLQTSAHGVDLCVGCSLRCVTVDLNRVNACHREFLRLRVHLAQTIDSLGPSPAFPYALPLTCGTSPFPRSRFDPQISGCCPQKMGTPSVSRRLAISFPRDLSFARSVDLHERVNPNSAVQTFTALPILTASWKSCIRLLFVKNVTDHRCALRRPNQGPRTQVLGQIRTGDLWPTSSSEDNLPKCWMHSP